MSFNNVLEVVNDPDFRNRLTVAVTQANIAPAGAQAWVTMHAMQVASDKAIQDAWEYSKNVHKYHSCRGRDELVITDQAIIDAVARVAGEIS